MLSNTLRNTSKIHNNRKGSQHPQVRIVSAGEASMHIAVPTLFALYSLLQLILGLILKLSPKPFCKNDVDQSYVVTVSHLCVLFVFVYNGLTQIEKINRYWKSGLIFRLSMMKLHASLLCISLMSSTTLIVFLTAEFRLRCFDTFGVATLPAMWVEWFGSVPLLVYLAISVGPPKESYYDITAITSSGLMILSGFMMIPTHESLGANIFFIITAFFSWLVFMFNVMYRQRKFDKQVFSEVDERLCILIKRQFDLKSSLLNSLVLFFPLFPLVYLLGVSKAIGEDGTIVGFLLAGVSVKLLFADFVIDNHVQMLNEFEGYWYSYYEVEKAQAEAEKRMKDLRTTMANVAHDLKTPLIGFMSGVEFVKKTAKEVIKIEKDEPLPTSPVVVPKLESICSASDNMRNINNFMLMTINRSIDFTKATKGLVLIPHYDTVNIEESLKTVVDCMTDLQQRIPIKVNPLPNDISKYILTDKTWFQENMLCLLSNAVRYSIIGSVTISISLTTNDELKQLSSLFINTMKGVQRPSSVNRSGRRLSVESSTGRKKQKDDAEKEDSESTGRRLGSLQISIAEDDDEMINDVDRDTSIQKPMLLVEVEDYGKGLSNHEMLNLFRPSEQVQQSLGGTGLGMYSLSRRVLTLDGYYGVRLKKDKIPNAKGSIFWFGIPYIIDSEADLDSDHSSADHQEVSLNTSLEPNLMSKIAARDRGPEARILLVDNSFSVLKLLAMNLRSEGFDVDEIENGIFFLEVMKNSVKTGLSRAENDATECAKRNGDSSSNKLPSLYDVVLIDVHMEPMSGVEAVKEFRDFESKEMTGYSRQRIIFMSASSDDITSDGVQAADVDGFLTKPLEMIKLKELLTNFHKLKFFQL